MPHTGLPLERPPIKLSQLLETGLRTKPHEPALVSFESKWTWRELDQASRRLGAHYLWLGLKPGDRVASLLPNRGALIVHYLACIQSRARRHSAQLSLSGARNRSRTRSQRRRGDPRPRRARRGPGEKQAGRSIAPRSNFVRRRRQPEAESGRILGNGASKARSARAAARRARIHLFHVRQHGQTERCDAHP